jgi:hypothetical protein
MLCLLRFAASERPPPFRLAEPLQALCEFTLRALRQTTDAERTTRSSKMSFPTCEAIKGFYCVSPSS